MYVSVLHCGSEGQRKLAPTQRLGPGFQVQVVRLGSRGIYSVNHLAGVCVCVYTYSVSATAVWGSPEVSFEECFLYLFCGFQRSN